MIRFKIDNRTKRLSEVRRGDLERDLTHRANVGEVVSEFMQWDGFIQIFTVHISKLSTMPDIVILKWCSTEDIVFYSLVSNHITIHIVGLQVVKVCDMRADGSHSHHMTYSSLDAVSQVIHLLTIQFLTVNLLRQLIHVYRIHFQLIDAVKLFYIKRARFLIGIHTEGTPRLVSRIDREALSLTPNEKRFNLSDVLTYGVGLVLLHEKRNKLVIEYVCDLFKLYTSKLHKTLKGYLVMMDRLISNQSVSSVVHRLALGFNKIFKVRLNRSTFSGVGLDLVGDHLKTGFDVLIAPGGNGIKHQPFFYLVFDTVKFLIDKLRVFTSDTLIYPFIFRGFVLGSMGVALTINGYEYANRAGRKYLKGGHD